MLRRSFRLGLRVGLLVGVILAIVKVVQARRESDTAPAADAWRTGGPTWTPPPPREEAPAAPAPPLVEPEPQAETRPEVSAAEPAPEPPSIEPPAPPEVPVVAEPEPAPRTRTIARPAAKSPRETKAPAVTWVEPTGSTCPGSHPIKAKLSSRIFHLPGMFAYERTRPDRCYPDEPAAESDGFTRARR